MKGLRHRVIFLFIILPLFIAGLPLNLPGADHNNPLITAAHAQTERPACGSDTPNPTPSTQVEQVYRASSVDGLNFEAGNVMLLNQASAPDVVLNGNDTWIYYFNRNPNEQGIWVARQTNTGSFEVVTCIKLDNTVVPQATAPDAMLHDGSLRLFYQQNNNIFLAESSDGINFTVQKQVIGGTNPSVVQLADGQWLLAFQSGNHIDFATSEDGLNFNRISSNGINSRGAPELMVLSDGQVRLLIGGQNLTSFISTDNGTSWVAEQPAATLQNQPPAATGSQHPSVTELPNNRWMLFYTVTTVDDGSGGSISGVIELQGRNQFAGAEIYLSENDCPNMTLPDTPQTVTDETGYFELSVGAGEEYRCLLAVNPGYLSGQQNNPSEDIGAIVLLGGDVNTDEVIDIFDLALIAASYDSSDPTLDINGDGTVDIFDLTITAVNFKKRGPIS